MRKNSYILELSPNCNIHCFQIFQFAPIPIEIQEGSVLSQNSLIRNHIPVGTMSQTQSSCCTHLTSMKLIMYDQHLSIAQSNNKSCFGIDFCCHQLTVATPKKVAIGKIVKKFFCSHEHYLEILDNDNKIIYLIKTTLLQTILPYCCGLFKCCNHLRYDIVDSQNKAVGRIEAYSRHCSSYPSIYEIHFSEKTELKKKILLLNSIALLC